MIPIAANSLWLSACLPEYLRFRHAVSRVVATQAAVLHEIISANSDSEIGRTHRFSSIRSVRDFQQQVPVRSYEEYQDWITRIAEARHGVLTAEPVQLFEPTSGSTGASKLVPYTTTLQRQFRRGIYAWIASLFLHHPQLLTGRAYWSISPAMAQARYTAGGIPIGFAEDSAYLGGWQQRLINGILAVPGVLNRVQDVDAFRYLSLLFLVACRELKLISVWNPTFLSVLVEWLSEFGQQIAHDLEQGTVSRGAEYLPFPLRLQPDPQRACELRSALSCTTAERHVRLWPGLRLISCWTDANAAAPAAALQVLFPQAQIQGKGLVATEAFVSFPMTHHDGAALALRSHFFEFLPAGESHESRLLLVHELEKGRQYNLVVTTGGGFYRYRMGDCVEVVGYLCECPMVRFVGRCDRVSDWFGEKLNEAFVTRVLGETFAGAGLSPVFAMLACHPCGGPAYVLYIESKASDEVLISVGEKIEEALCQNFHYQYARRIGQLHALRVFRAENASATYLSMAVSQGQRVGSVKPVALDPRDIWSDVFRGSFVCASQSETTNLRQQKYA